MCVCVSRASGEKDEQHKGRVHNIFPFKLRENIMALFPQDTFTSSIYLNCVEKKFRLSTTAVGGWASERENYTEIAYTEAHNINVKVWIKSKKPFKGKSLLSGFSCRSFRLSPSLRWLLFAPFVIIWGSRDARWVRRGEPFNDQPSSALEDEEAQISFRLLMWKIEAQRA